MINTVSQQGNGENIGNDQGFIRFATFFVTGHVMRLVPAG
jgi:hypothetical protein